MSFNNISSDLESSGADARSIHYKDFPEFETLSHEIESILHQVNSKQLPSFKNLVSEYDSILRDDDDSDKATKLNQFAPKVSEEIEQIIKNFKLINELTQKVNKYLNECEHNREDEDSLRYLRQKESLLINLVKSSLRTYQTFQRKYELLQQNTINKYDKSKGQPSNANPSIEGDENQVQTQIQVPGTNIQEQVQISYEPVNAEELEQQTLLIQEREREIEQISQDITYINEIYSNLEDIVHEQQFTIDTIEDNLLRYTDDVHGASNELRRAERYQRRSGGRMLCCLFILLGILAFIILISVIF